jgi:hypothetical protein
VRSLFDDMQILSGLLRRYSVQYDGERCLMVAPEAKLTLDRRRNRLKIDVILIEDACRFFADKSNLGG